KESDFKNLTYDEEGHLKDNDYYLENNEQISDEVGNEVISMIKQRQDILSGVEDEFDSLLETVDEKGDQLKEEITEKGDEMKEKYDKDKRDYKQRNDAHV